MHIFARILFIIFLTLFNGCTVQEKNWETASPIFIKEEAKKYLNSTRVVVSIDQDKRLGIPVMGQRTSHQYFGVVGKLAESGMVRFKNDLSEEQRKLLRDVDKAAYRFDTGVKFRVTAEKKLRSLDWLKIRNGINLTDIQIPDIERMVKTQDEDAMLLIDSRYLMAIDFSSISVFSYVTLYANEKSLVKLAKAAKPYEDPPTLYKNLFSYEFRYKGSYVTADDALKGWSKNEGEMVQLAIQESINDLTSQIAEDLSFTTVEK